MPASDNLDLCVVGGGGFFFKDGPLTSYQALFTYTYIPLQA